MINGIINVYKEKGYTSHDVVARLRGILHQKKIGHTGTLDPNAEGVLPVCLGKGTKLCDMLTDTDKEYRAVIRLGVKTDTQDITGTVIEKREVNADISEEKITEVIMSFVGEYMQVPPMYSALKVNGEPLYKKARRGEVVERKERDVTISSIDLLSVTNQRFMIKVNCSKGTYIRTLGVDISNDFGYGGHLTMLTRTRVGKYKLEECKSVEDITEEDIIPISKALDHMATKVVYGFLESKVRNGVSLYLGEEELLFVKNNNDEPLAIYQKKEDGKHHCLRGLF